MEIRIIENKDFIDLVQLTTEMYQEINPKINAFQATNSLIHMINNEVNFFAIGLYDEDILMGFVTGHELTETTFLFTGIYISFRNSEEIKRLIEYSFDFIKDKGYKAWEADANNANISSILEKYGASIRYTRYHKEFD